MHVHRLLVLLLAPQFGFLGATPAPSTVRPDAQRLARFITQLGSNDFKERQAATQALDALGPAALEALHKASQAHDPEVRRRAESLAHAIEKRVETAELLEPQHVRLVYQDTPLDEAVKDFARKTGFSIRLEGGSRAYEKKITLDTGETTFWQAFDQFCEKAGLKERVVQPETVQTTRAFQIQQGPRLGGVVISQHQTAPSAGEGPLTLVLGKEKSAPTCQAGAVRIRALPATGSAWSQAPPAGETLFVLEVTPQPKMGWQNIDTRIDRAIDDNDQNLAPILATSDDALRIAAALANNGAIIWDAQTGRPMVGSARQLPVRLKLGDKPSRTLKEIEGVVLAQVQTPPRTLLTVDKILKSAGQTNKNADGNQLKILDVKHKTGGAVMVRLQLEDPLPPGMIAFNRRGVMRINGALAKRGMVVSESQSSGGDASFALLDANGQSFRQEERNDSLSTNGRSICWEIELTYRPHEGQGEPAKLVYSGRRWVVIEVPFTLKDVPVW
jgi:hypothetical protein